MENDNIIYENPVKHLQCDGKINNVTLKTLRIQLWKSVLVNYFGKSKTNVQTQKTGVVIKVIFDTEKEKNNSVKINMYDSVVIQGAKCTVFSDAFFHKLKQECDNKNSEKGNHISTEDLHQTAVKVITISRLIIASLCVNLRVQKILCVTRHLITKPQMKIHHKSLHVYQNLEVWKIFIVCQRYKVEEIVTFLKLLKHR